MHSSLVRIQNVFGFFTTVAFTVAGLIALSVLFFPQSPTANIEVRNVQVVKGRPHYYSSKREEYAHIKFDLDADLSSLYTWNTKLLFLYVSASYPSHNTSAPRSEAIIWDHILPSPSLSNPPSLLSFLGSTDSAFPPYLRSSSSSKPRSKAKPKKDKKKKERDWSKPDPDAPLGVVKVRNVKPKYQITDISGTLAEREGVRLEVGWNIQPWVGALQWGWSLSSPPSAYTFSSKDVEAEGAKEKSWLGKAAWKWKEMEGGVSETFEFPPLVGKKKKEVPATEEKIMGRGEVPRAGEATPVVEI